MKSKSTELACSRLVKELKVEKGRRQFVLTGEIHDHFFIDSARGVCDNIEDALFAYAMAQGYDIVAAFDENVQLRFATSEMARLYRETVEKASVDPNATEDSEPWSDDAPTTSPNGQRPDTQAAVAQTTQQSNTREQAIFDQILHRLLPRYYKSFIIFRNPDSVIQCDQSGSLTPESRKKLETILSWAKPPKLGHQDTCSLLLVAQEKHVVFLATADLCISGIDDRQKRLCIAKPNAEEIEALLARVQHRYGLTGFPKTVAKDVVARYIDASGDSLYNVVSMIARKLQTSPTPQTLDALFADEIGEEEKRKFFDEAHKELQAMIGLDAVKKKVEELIAQAKKQKASQSAGKDKRAFNLHSFLLGNPGTGKTVVARILGKMYYALGIRSSQAVVEISAADISSPFNPGDTTINLQNKINEAMGGVLFIDEVYQFAEDQWLRGAFEKTLMKAMEDHRDRFTVLAAGYGGEQLRAVLNINPGVPRRFNHPENTIEFPDYSLEELMQIAEKMLEKEGYTLTAAARDAMRKYIETRKRQGKIDNAGGVRNLVDTMIKRSEDDEIDVENVPDVVRQHETVDDILRELDEKFIGLQNVKDQIRRIAKRIEAEERRGNVVDKKYNMQFVGNPGTGKTTIARYMSRVFNALGLIEGTDVIEIAGTALKGSYLGQSKDAVIDAFTQAREEGKVLFIDEAHNLYTSPHDQDIYAKEVIAQLVQEVTATKNMRVFTILAGYPEPMARLMKADVGLPRRFPTNRIVTFPDYTTEECLEILHRYIAKNSREFDQNECDAINQRLVKIISTRKAACGDEFGNAGDMGTLSETILENLDVRDSSSDVITLADLPPL